MLGYTVHDLTTAQKQQRRAALDALGHHIVLSQLALAVCAYIYLRVRRRGDTGWVRRLEWRLMRPRNWEDPESRSMADWMVGVGWLGWCVWGVVRGSGDDYLHLTKAFGTATSSNLPALILLSMKRSPLRYIYGVSYDGKVNYLHQGLAKTVYMLICAHVGLYLKFFWDTNRVGTRLLEWDVLCGVVGAVGMNILVLLSYPPIRKYYYRLFLSTHIATSAILLPLLYLHVPHHRPYILASGLFLLYDRAIRYLRALPATASISLPTPTTLKITLNLPTPAPYAPPISHLLLSIPSLTPTLTFNPFTVASANPSTLTLIARVRNTTTKRMAALAAKEPLQLPARVEAFYSTPSHVGIAKSFDRVVVIAGGVGGAWGVPWVRQLAREGVLERVTFVWVVRSVAETAWALEGERVLGGKVELFITGGEVEEREEGVEMVSLLGGGSGEDGEGGEGREGVRRRVAGWGVGRDRVYFGRPEVEMLVDDAAAGERSVAVLVCGPVGLGARVKACVGVCVERGERVWAHVEEFAR